MAKFCTECGNEIKDGVAFCTECGTKAPAEPAPKVSEPREVHTPPPIPQAQKPAPMQQPAPIQQPMVASDENKVVGTGTYFGLMLLFALPIIGIIVCIIMCFAPKNRNLKNFAKATLIWAIIGFVIGALLVGGILLLTNSFMDYISQSSGVQFESFGDLMSQLG